MDRLLAKRGGQLAFALREKREIGADPDDLGGGIKRRPEIVDDRWPEAHRPFFQPDIGPIGVAHQPVLTAEYPDLDPSRVEQVDDRIERRLAPADGWK